MKQEATFTTVQGWVDAGNRGIAAMLNGIVGHPRLGEQNWVRTSRVESVGYNSAGEVDYIETQNTIYTRSQENN